MVKTIEVSTIHTKQDFNIPELDLFYNFNDSNPLTNTMTGKSIMTKKYVSNDDYKILEKKILDMQSIIQEKNNKIKHIEDRDENMINNSKWIQMNQDVYPVNAFNDGLTENSFGWATSLNYNGSIIAVGSPSENNTGIVRIYQYKQVRETEWNNESTIIGGIEKKKWNELNEDEQKNFYWIQMGQDIINNEISGRSGSAISLNSIGNIIAISCYGCSEFKGVTRIYKFIDDNRWEKIGQNINGEYNFDRSGYNHGVSLNSDGNIIVIGAPFNNDSQIGAGHVRVYEYIYSSNKWIQLGYDIDGNNKFTYSGLGVSINSKGDIIAIGSPNADSGDKKLTGLIRIFQYKSVNNEIWNKSIIIKNTESDLWSDLTIEEQNRKYWVQVGNTIYGSNSEDQYDTYESPIINVSLNGNGNIVAFPSKNNDGNGFDSGHVRIFNYNSDKDEWNQMGQDILGEKKYDLFGISCSISSDGYKIAIGSSWNMGNSTDPNNPYSNLRVFRYSKNNNKWIQLGSDINNNSGWGGYSVSLSGNGNTVVLDNSGTGLIGIFKAYTPMFL